MTNFILERVKIEGFKSIQSLDLTLKHLNILIGANGSGKSNFIAVFKFLNQMVNKNLQLFVGKSGGVNTILHFGQKFTEQIELYFQFGNDSYLNAYECTLIPAIDESLIFAQESVYFQNKIRFEEPIGNFLGKGHFESKLSEYKRIAKYVHLTIETWKVYHFHDTSDTAKVKQSCDIDDNLFLRVDGANLAAYLYLLQEKERLYYDNIIDTIRLIAPFFDNFNLHPNSLNESKIKLEWRAKGSDTYFDAHALSDGTLRFICLATLLLQPPESMSQLILLDEPELGLHPYAITVLASLLHKVAKHTQVIVSTQSVTLVNQFEPDDIIVVESREGKSIFNRLSEAQIETWLDDYSLGDLWEKNLIGGRPTL